MMFKPSDSDNDDFFESTPSPEAPKPPKAPKPPVLTPDDPGYWEAEESEWEHLRAARPRGSKLWMWLVASIVVLGTIIGFWMRYFAPYVDDAVQYGYIDHIERRGTVFKTYEGILIPYKELRDTSRVYRRDFVFSAVDSKVAVKLRRMQLDARPVMVHYRRYHATLPWRGAAKIVVTDIDSVDPSKILPPEYNPLYHAQSASTAP